ncbi:hypothetical protein OESDEN_02469 [Oesophagostomum dentatum]|uniref:N-acetyltransferase domain-containing protein n=1 Tax=Oesophagostomum dentatum TaxID=61180 RepID=A0A0B1TN92_OESDE|nr:hypothetical protein OESDEN_02469 [Oesophagostomum dentatum]
MPWNTVDPSVLKILQREITYISSEYRRRGKANCLIHLGLDFESLRNEGVQCISSVASSLANQKPLAKYGYVYLARPEYEFEMYDGNEGIMV